MSDQEKLAEFLARGGQIKKCPPGPSENIVYISGPRFRRAQKPADKPAPSE